MDSRLPKKLRKHFSGNALIRQVRAGFEQVDVPRPPGANISGADALMAAFAMFSLKCPSLLSFDKERANANLQAIYHIDRVPCDTAMREILDEQPPEQLRPVYTDLFGLLQRNKVLQRFEFWDGHYLLALDGTGYFSSHTIHCSHCQVKVSQNGQVTYAHQMLGAALVHPDHQEVIPLCPEMILKQDGQTKNDCERNAAKRLLRRIRQEHPRLPLIVIEDALSSNAPHIEEIQRQNMHFLLGVKPGDHAYLFEHLEGAINDGRVEYREHVLAGSGHSAQTLVARGLPLNESNEHLLVTVLGYWEYDALGKLVKEFTWVTDLAIEAGDAFHFARGGRCRWRIENETFNTLKNQGYHFEHNFGHGQKHLSSVFATLMVLAFLVDQIQQACCPLFQAAWQKCQSKRSLWEQLRAHFLNWNFTSMVHLLEAIVLESTKAMRVPPSILDSS